MFAINALLAGGSLTPIPYEYNGYTEDASPGTSNTFSTVDIGTAAADRLVVVIVAIETATGIGTDLIALTSGSIGGVSATVSSRGGSKSRLVRAMWAEVPSGATGDIDVNFSDPPTEKIGIGVYSLYGASSTMHDESGNTIDIPAGGLAIAAYATTSVDHSDISGVDTEDEDETGGSLNVTIGTKGATTALTSYAFSPCMHAVSFGPA